LQLLPFGEGWVVKNLEKMENKKEMRNWLNEFNLTHPLNTGPCSAETEEQVKIT
jgi:hypothetical protein